MGRFDNLLKGKEKSINIGDEVFVIRPLNSENLGLFFDLEDNKEEAIKEIVFQSLHQFDKTITRDDVKELPAGLSLQIFAIAMDVNEQTSETKDLKKHKD